MNCSSQIFMNSCLCHRLISMLHTASKNSWAMAASRLLCYIRHMLCSAAHSHRALHPQVARAFSKWLNYSTTTLRYKERSHPTQISVLNFSHIFCCWPPPMWCLKAKNSNSYCSSEGRYRANPKKYGYPANKVWQGFRGFRTYFLLSTTPYVMFESKKLKFFLLIRRKE